MKVKECIFHGPDDEAEDETLDEGCPTYDSSDEPTIAAIDHE